jgi:PEP-CTERM motif
MLPRGNAATRASKKKHLISLLTLLFLAPDFASAACSPMSNSCVATTGTAVSDGSSSNPFNFAGNSFSASGAFAFGASPNLGFPNLPGYYPAQLAGSYPDTLLSSFALTVNGVPWGIPAGSTAWLNFYGTPLIFADGQSSSASFIFSGEFTGAPEPFSPGLGCDGLNCKTFDFSGVGTVTIDVTPDTYGSCSFCFDVVRETYTFGVVPEPATLSLFALGLASVGLMRRRKKS